MKSATASALRSWGLQLLMFGMAFSGTFVVGKYLDLWSGKNDLDHFWRDRLASDSPRRPLKDAAADVVYIRLNDAGKNVFSQWPPSPMDWAALLEKIVAEDPAILVIDPLLRWKNGDSVSLEAVKQRLLRVPVVLLGVERGSVADAVWPTETAARYLTPVASSRETLSGLTEKEYLGGVIPPDSLIAAAGTEAVREGFGPDGAGYPMILWDNREVYPSMLLECLMRWWECPSKDLEMKAEAKESSFEFRGGYHLVGSADGRVPLDPNLHEFLPRVGAGAFFSGNSDDLLLDATDTPNFSKKNLEGKIVVVGVDTKETRKIALPDQTLISPSERFALSLATALAVEPVRSIQGNGAYFFSGILALATLLMGRGRPLAIICKSTAVLLVSLLIAWLVFRHQHALIAPSLTFVAWIEALVVSLLFPRTPTS